MRVLHVTETARGGVGSYLDELIPLQIEALGDSNVMAVVPDEHRAQLRSVGDNRLVQFHRPERSIAAIMDLRRRLRDLIHGFRPDVVHLHSTFAGGVGRMMIGERAKIIYTPHGWSFEMWPDGPRRRYAQLAERALAARCHCIVAVSEAERRQGLAAGIDDRKIAVVLNGISAQRPKVRAATWKDQRLKVLFIGRLDRQKGIDTIADLAAKHVDEIVLRIAGEAVVSESAREFSSPNIHHLGWLNRSDIEAELQACDVVAMPSRWEGLSITALEAMRAAKPIVAFAVGGLAEAIEEGVTGCAVAPDDCPAFERALLSRTRAQWKSMGADAEERFQQRFTSRRMSDQLLEIYRERG